MNEEKPSPTNLAERFPRMRPIKNAPGLMTELESMLTRNELSDPKQLVPLLTELKTDEHIPLIARNHADRILKRIEK